MLKKKYPSCPTTNPTNGQSSGISNADDSVEDGRWSSVSGLEPPPPDYNDHNFSNAAPPPYQIVYSTPATYRKEKEYPEVPTAFLTPSFTSLRYETSTPNSDDDSASPKNVLTKKQKFIVLTTFFSWFAFCIMFLCIASIYQPDDICAPYYPKGNKDKRVDAIQFHMWMFFTGGVWCLNNMFVSLGIFLTCLKNPKRQKTGRGMIQGASFFCGICLFLGMVSGAIALTTVQMDHCTTWIYAVAVTNVALHPIITFFAIVYSKVISKQNTRTRSLQ